jgi:hypothetical protein
MRQNARRFLGFLLIAALAAGLGAPVAFAQEVQLDPNTLDAPAPAKPAGKKAKGAAAPTAAGAAAQPQAQQGGKPRPDRQFGELEGWSPGKEPPKPKDAPNTTGSSTSNSMPVKVSPGGNMGTGFSF